MRLRKTQVKKGADIKLSEQQIITTASCRFCHKRVGEYCVEDTLTGEVYFLCEKHKDYEPEGELL